MSLSDAKLNIQLSLQMGLNIFYGLNHVHEEYHTHGDMKPHNVLVISDFHFILQQQYATKIFIT